MSYEFAIAFFGLLLVGVVLDEVQTFDGGLGSVSSLDEGVGPDCIATIGWV